MGDKTTIKDEVASAVKEAMAVAHTNATAAASTLAMSVDIGYIKADIKEIKDFQKDVVKSFITTSDFTEHLKADADHEVRIRALEDQKSENALVKKLVFGCVTVILVGVVSALFLLIKK